MADGIDPNVATQAANQFAETIQATQKTSNSSFIDIKSNIKDVAASMKEGSKAAAIWKMRTVAALGPIIQSFNKLGNAVEKQSMQIEAIGENLAAAAHEANAAQEELDVLTKVLDKANAALNRAVKSGNAEGDVLQRLKEDVARASDEQRKATQRVNNANAAHTDLTTTMVKEAKKLTDLEEKYSKLGDSMTEDIRKLHRMKAAQEMAAGGVKNSLVGNLRMAVAESNKLWSVFEKGAPIAIAAYSLKKLGEVATDYFSYIKADTAASMQFGKISTASFNDMNKAMVETTRTAGALGMSFEEVNNITSKFRFGVIVDRNGKMSETALQALTKETAYFSKVAGIDAAEATDMMTYRIKTLGMSSDEAIQNMQNMRTTLTQIMNTSDKANVPLKEMVGIVDEASRETGAYVVDTRILAQALQGAANQAANLGVSSKQAADVAKGVGKVLSKAPEYIKYPAGQSLLNKLMGSDYEKLLSKLNKSQRDNLLQIRQDLNTGALDYYSAVNATMDTIGGADVAINEEFEQLKSTLLQKGGASTALIKSQFGIENWSTARIVTKQLQDAAEAQDYVRADLKEQMDNMRKDKSGNLRAVEDLSEQERQAWSDLNQKLKDGGLSISAAMVINGEKAIEAIEGLSDSAAIDKLKETGLSDEDANEYLTTYKTIKDARAADIEKLQKMETDGVSTAKQIAAQKVRIHTEYVEKLGKISGRTDPYEKAKSDIEKITGGNSKITIDEKEKKGGLTDATKKLVAELATRSKVDAKKLEDQLLKEKEIDAEFMGNLSKENQKAIDTQNAEMDKIATQFAQGPVAGLKALIDKYLPQLNTGYGKLATAFITGVASIVLAIGGQSLSLLMLSKLTPLQVEDSSSSSSEGKKSKLAEMKDKAKGGWNFLKNLGGSGKWGMGAGSAFATQAGWMGNAARFMGGKAGNFAGGGSAIAGGMNVYKGIQQDSTGYKLLGGAQLAAGALAQLPGPIGAVAKAFSVGTVIGEGLNAALEYTWFSAERSGAGMLWLAEKAGYTADGLSNLGDDLKKQHEITAKSFGITLEQYDRYKKEATANKMSLKAYLEQNKLGNFGATKSSSAALEDAYKKGTISLYERNSANPQAPTSALVGPPAPVAPPTGPLTPPKSGANASPKIGEIVAQVTPISAIGNDATLKIIGLRALDSAYSADRRPKI